jgi:hypothetical protein
MLMRQGKRAPIRGSHATRALMSCIFLSDLGRHLALCMRWHARGVQAVASLRALHRSGHWTAFWQSQPQRRRPPRSVRRRARRALPAAPRCSRPRRPSRPGRRVLSPSAIGHPHRETRRPPRPQQPTPRRGARPVRRPIIRGGACPPVVRAPPERPSTFLRCTRLAESVLTCTMRGVQTGNGPFDQGREGVRRRLLLEPSPSTANRQR